MFVEFVQFLLTVLQKLCALELQYLVLCMFVKRLSLVTRASYVITMSAFFDNNDEYLIWSLWEIRALLCHTVLINH